MAWSYSDQYMLPVQYMYLGVFRLNLLGVDLRVGEDDPTPPLHPVLLLKL